MEMTSLRRVCSRGETIVTMFLTLGIPDQPLHLRPLAYSLLLDVLPPEKRYWRSALRKQKEHYYVGSIYFPESYADTVDPRSNLHGSPTIHACGKSCRYILKTADPTSQQIHPPRSTLSSPKFSRT